MMCHRNKGWRRWKQARWGNATGTALFTSASLEPDSGWHMVGTSSKCVESDVCGECFHAPLKHTWRIRKEIKKKQGEHCIKFDLIKVQCSGQGMEHIAQKSGARAASRETGNSPKWWECKLVLPPWKTTSEKILGMPSWPVSRTYISWSQGCWVPAPCWV